MSFDVHVVNHKGEGIRGLRVRLSFEGLTRGITGTEYTDGDGHAIFDGYENGEVEVYVDGTSYGTYRYRSGESITISR